MRSRQGSAKGDGPVNTEPIVSSPTAEDGARAKRAPKNRALAGDMLAASHSTNDLSGLSKKAALRAVVGDPISGGKFFGESWEGSGSQPGSPKAGGVDGEGARTPHYMSSLKGVMKNAFSRSKSQKEMASPKSRSGLMSRVTPKGSNSST